MTNAKDAQRAFGTWPDTASEASCVHAMANVGVHPSNAAPGTGVRFRCVNRLIGTSRGRRGGTLDAPSLSLGAKCGQKRFCAGALQYLGRRCASRTSIRKPTAR